MGLSKVTIEAINNNKDKFSIELQRTIAEMIDYSNKYSPLSDINYLIEKYNLKFLGVKFKHNQGSWMPIRNVIRIIANVSTVTGEGEHITEIQIDDMYCGCDYFQGHLGYQLKGKGMMVGNYKWQWSKFEGFDRNFDKFIEFPNKLLSYEKIAI